MKIGFIGCGVYALALARILKINNCKIVMWSKFKGETGELEKKYDYINFTNNFEDIQNSDLIIVAIPSSFVIDTLEEYKNYYMGEDILIASKGILRDSSFISDSVKRILNTDKISVISGPTFAVDIEDKIPLGLSLGSNQEKSLSLVKKAFETDYLKLEVIDDVEGIEFCGSVKNVIAISTGIIDGLGYPESTRYMYLTKIIKKLKEVIVLLGGKKETIDSYAGIGDLFLTSTCSKSRNYSFGVVIGKNEDMDNYLKNNTTEGYYSLKEIYNLCIDKKIDFEIIDILYKIIYEENDLNLFIDYLKK